MESNFTITIVVGLVLAVVLIFGYEIMLQNEEKLQLATESTMSIKDGDKVNIDFVSYIDGVAYDGATTGGKGADLTIGSDTMTEMEQQLIDAHPGDTLDIWITFPKDYSHNKTLAGNEVLFVVKVNGIYVPA